MNYYDLLVATKSKTTSVFTYKHSAELAIGQVVTVPFRSYTYYAVVVNKSTHRPKTKSILNVLEGSVVPTQLLAACLKMTKISALTHSGIANLLLGAANNRTTETPTPQKLNPLPALTPKQKIAVSGVLEHKAKTPVLLHGITGSGKTRIYQELCKKSLASGHSAIVLSPEVGLSSQLEKSMENLAPGCVITMHSRLTKKEKEIAWANLATSSEPYIVVGPRSSLFAPLKNVGLIVMDEFHDDSYKQSSEPRYHALHAASSLAAEHNAYLICGSATPNVADYYNFQKQNYPIIELNSKAKKGAKPAEIAIVDMTKEAKHQLLSEQSIDAIDHALRQGSQSLVFFNRRGTNRLAICDNCGWQHACATCEYNMTLHKDRSKLVCHSCGHQESALSACPDCSHKITYRVPGIKKLEEELTNRFENANIVRFDSDTAKDQSLVNQLQQVKKTKKTIILGTQMISKGLDMPLLSLVVVVRAESSLSVPDYRAEEKMYQLTSQLIGRVGRGHQEDTKVIVQSHTPDNPTLLNALKGKWKDFYNQELEHRKTAGFPPFSYTAVIRVRRKSQAGVTKAADAIYDKLKQQYPRLDVRQPSPALQEKKPSGYEWIIHVFSPRRSVLVAIAKDIGGKEIVDIDPTQLF